MTMQEKLRKQLHFKSLVSSKVYYGLDCDKQMQENVKVQLRLLEHEYNRKRNYRSDMAHKNEQLQEVIDECRLQKMNMRESGQELEAKFAEAQEQMRLRMVDANAIKLTNAKIEDAVEQLTLRAEKQINEQSEEILAKRAEIARLTEKAENVEASVSETLPSADEMLQAGLLSLEEEQEMRQRMRMLRHGIVDEAKRVEDSARRIMNHEMAFERLRQETELSDLGEIVQLFVSREDDNFAIYSHLQRVEETLQKEEQALRDLQEQTAEYRENAKVRQGSTSSKFKALERQRDQLRDKLKAQQQVKKGLRAQQRQWSDAIVEFLQVLVASGIEFQSKLLTQPAAVAVVDQVRGSMSSGSGHNNRIVTNKAATAPVTFVDSNLEVALSIIEQCTSELVARGLPVLRSMGSAAKSLNKHGMSSPPTGHVGANDRAARWSVDPPSFAALEADEDGNKASTKPFDSTIDRAALVAAITKKSMELSHKATRRGSTVKHHPSSSASTE